MNPKALIVDDEKIIRNLLEAIVVNLGFEVTTADNGNLAENALMSDDFDLVITDLEMGNTNGFQVIERAKSIDESTIVMVATGCLDERCRRQATVLGASDYLLKPFSVTDLEKRINKQFAHLKRSPKSSWKKKSQTRCQDVFQFVKQSVCRQDYLQLKTEQKVIV
jgi:DNA-binding response OmpR family regulator